MNTACIIDARRVDDRMRSSVDTPLQPVCDQAMIDYAVSLAGQLKMAPVLLLVDSEEVGAYVKENFGQDVQCQMATDAGLSTHLGRLSKSAERVVVMPADVPLLSKKSLNDLLRALRKVDVASLCYAADQQEMSSQICALNPAAMKQAARMKPDRVADVLNMTSDGRLEMNRVLALRQEVQGIRHRRDLAHAEHTLNQRLLCKLMDAGVSIQDPLTTYVGAQVKVGADSVILAGCHLRGKVRVGRGCRIGPGAIIENARISDRAEIRAYSVLDDCQVGKQAIVGPFARLRPGTELMPTAHVGNFVELKKTKLGKGSKANHLSYLGDSQIGSGVNVGAGTITCNYDGVNKFSTEIGNGAFIGSGTQLVAPVKVGRQAYIGAGSTITQDVPDQALAISRVKQKNVAGYARWKKKKNK